MNLIQGIPYFKKHIPVDLSYFNQMAMQHSKSTEALLAHGSVATASSDKYQVCRGRWGGSLLLPGGAAITDVLVRSLVGQYRGSS